MTRLGRDERQQQQIEREPFTSNETKHSHNLIRRDYQLVFFSVSMVILCDMLFVRLSINLLLIVLTPLVAVTFNRMVVFFSLSALTRCRLFKRSTCLFMLVISIIECVSVGVSEYVSV